MPNIEFNAIVAYVRILLLPAFYWLWDSINWIMIESNWTDELKECSIWSEIALQIGETKGVKDKKK